MLFQNEGKIMWIKNYNLLSFVFNWENIFLKLFYILPYFPVHMSEVRFFLEHPNNTSLNSSVDMRSEKVSRPINWSNFGDFLQYASNEAVSDYDV